MPTLTNKELLQINNIMDTILEASEHFSKLIKNKEFNQSIFMFSSIVEGFDSVSKLIVATDKCEFTKQKDKMDKYLLMIAQHLEKGDFIKIAEILQFSFLPHLKKLHNLFAEEVSDTQKNKTFSIGVFSSQRNPRDFYTESRVSALVQESEKQNAQLLFFTSNDVDFDKKEITADVWLDGIWERMMAPFPDVINNVGVGRSSHTERKLRRQIPFTSFHVGNKYSLPKRIVQHRKYAELLVPFQVCRSEEKIHDFLNENNKVVFKALLGNRGENIYFVTKKGNRYVVLTHKKERILNIEAFNKWLESTILRLKGSYIIQYYIHTRTKMNEPYHIRAHVQKDGDGKWQLTHIYPRVGNKKSNLSNISTDGRIEDLHTFLEREYGELGAKYEHEILKLSMDLAWHLDKLHGLALDELGIDLAIDENGRYWMHEANNGPQTAYHEEKRAVNTIGYALYIAKNGLIHTDRTFSASSVKGQFNARTTNIPFAKLEGSPLIGMLVGKIVNDKLAIANVHAAQEENMSFYSFTQKDIDFDQMLIKGFFYENEKWVPKVVEYPDVIFDRLRLRGTSDAQIIYEELEEIPFTNEWPGQLKKRSELYEALQSSEELADSLPLYQIVTRARDIVRSIEKYGQVLLILDKTSFSSRGYYIEHLANGEYLVTSGTSEKKYREFGFMIFLKKLFEEGQFIIQKHPGNKTINEQPFEIHTHIMKNKKNNWSLASLYASFVEQKNNKSKEIYREDLAEFLNNHYTVDDPSAMEESIKKLSQEAVIVIEKLVEEPMGEVFLTLGIDNNNQLKLIDINPNGPEIIYDATETARGVISYASFLADLNEGVTLGEKVNV